MKREYGTNYSQGTQPIGVFHYGGYSREEMGCIAEMKVDKSNDFEDPAPSHNAMNFYPNDIESDNSPSCVSYAYAWKVLENVLILCRDLRQRVQSCTWH